MSSQQIASAPRFLNVIPLTPGRFWRDIFTTFRSVHLAIVLLSLLALCTIIGVVFPQEGMNEVADIQKQFGTNYALLNSLGLFTVFSSFWFITLQVLFFFNLLIGSFKWLKPATLAALHHTTLTPELLMLKPEVYSLPQPATGTTVEIATRMKAALKRFRYRVHTDAHGNVYAHKGSITRLGPSVAHIGILLCLIAGVYSCFTGFKAVKMAVPGQTFAIPESNSFKTNLPISVWLGSIPDWHIQVRDFKIEFYPDHPETAKQYTSTIRLITRKGEILKEAPVSVNQPLIYDNVSIYQASFAPTGRFLLTVDGRPTIATVNSQFNKRSISVISQPDGSLLFMFPFMAAQDPGVKKNYAVFFLHHPGEPMLRDQMPENIKLLEGETGHLKGTTITYKQPEMSTGLQIKRAPEVPLMYLSYVIIALGAVMCFFSQRQLWVSLKEITPGKMEVLLHPKTNKGRLSFRQELFAVQEALMAALNPPTTPSEAPRV